jgi:hypothetical protein
VGWVEEEEEEEEEKKADKKKMHSHSLSFHHQPAGGAYA